MAQRPALQTFVWRLRVRAPARATKNGLNLYHLKIVLARAALRARPVHGYIVPFRSWRDAVVCAALSLIVNPAADEAHVLFHENPVEK